MCHYCCALSRLSGLNLSPEETPEMSFEADVHSLRQAITSFGTISSQVCPSVLIYHFPYLLSGS